MEINQLYNEDNLVTLKRLPDNSLDSIVTDPPYGWSWRKYAAVRKALKLIPI